MPVADVTVITEGRFEAPGDDVTVKNVRVAVLRAGD
jgi:hypothetical protein